MCCVIKQEFTLSFSPAPFVFFLLDHLEAQKRGDCDLICQGRIVTAFNTSVSSPCAPTLGMEVEEVVVETQ